MKNQNWVLLCVVIAAIFGGMFVQSAIVSGLAQFNEYEYLDREIGGVLKASSAAGLLAGVLIGVVLIRYRAALSFADETVSELRQVVWPSRDETLRASTTVVLTTFFTAAVLAFYDMLWDNVTRYFFF